MPCYCCNNNLLIGCVPNCGQIQLNVPTTAGQVFALRYGFLEREDELLCIIANDGDKPSFDLSSLNDSYAFQASVWLDGSQIELADADGNVFDCLSFRTQFSSIKAFVYTSPVLTIIA